MELSVLIYQMIVLLILMVVGYVVFKLGVIDKVSNQKMSTVLINVCIPALLLTSSISGEKTLSNGDIAVVIGMSTLVYAISLAVAFGTTKLMRMPKHERGVYHVMMVFSNSFFLGIPIVAACYGAEAVFYVALANIPFTILIYTLGVALAAEGREKTGSGFQWKRLANPAATSAVLGMVLYVLDVQLPQVLVDPLKLLGNVTTPMAMLVIGSTLASISAKGILKDYRLYAMSFVRLILLPVIIFFVATGLGVDPTITGILTILTATPAAGNTTLICIEYGGDHIAAARGIFLSTVLSMITMPLVVWFLL